MAIYVGKCELQQRLEKFCPAYTQIPPGSSFVIHPLSFIDNKKLHFTELHVLITKLVENFVLDAHNSDLLKKIVENQTVCVEVILEKVLEIISHPQYKSYLINVEAEYMSQYLKLYVSPNVYDVLKEVISPELTRSIDTILLSEARHQQVNRLREKN